MDIKIIVRERLESLLEGKHKNHKYEYGCVMVYLGYDKKDWTELLSKIDDKDLYQPEDDPTYGKEVEPHITALFGLHDDIPDGEVEEVIEGFKKPRFNFKGMSLFKNDKFEVLKFDVEGEDLHKMNKTLAEFPHTNNFPDYHPHCTIAYLKAGMGDKYVEKLKDSTNIKVTCDRLGYTLSGGEKKWFDFK